MAIMVDPCSVRTLPEAASGATATLLTRAASVLLKKWRRLVMRMREAPQHADHIRNKLPKTEMDGVIVR